jgi:hypothetical protein
MAATYKVTIFINSRVTNISSTGYCTVLYTVAVAAIQMLIKMLSGVIFPGIHMAGVLRCVFGLANGV